MVCGPWDCINRCVLGISEAVLKAKLGPWLDEAYIVSVNIQEKLANLQSTQQKIKQDNAGLANKTDQVGNHTERG